MDRDGVRGLEASRTVLADWFDVNVLPISVHADVVLRFVSARTGSFGVPFGWVWSIDAVS